MAATNGKWDIIYYTTASGESPPYVFIESLDRRAKAKIYYTFELLEEFGLKLREPHVKKLTGTELWELRILGSDSIRMLYLAIAGKKFLILHGFVKKKMKIDKKEVKTAEARLADYKNKK